MGVAMSKHKEKKKKQTATKSNICVYVISVEIDHTGNNKYWRDYVNDHGEPSTLKFTNKGEHKYYFTYDSSLPQLSETEQYVIGIDIDIVNCDKSMLPPNINTSPRQLNDYLNNLPTKSIRDVIFDTTEMTY